MTRKEENLFRKKNTFSTLEIYDKGDEMVVTRIILYENWDMEKYQGNPKHTWCRFVLSRYSEMIMEAIKAHMRKKELEKWLEEEPGVAKIEELVDIEKTDFISDWYLYLYFINYI